MALGYHPAEHPPGHWNRTTITVESGKLKVTTNGKPVTTTAPLGDAPPTGRIGLAHFGVPMEYANIFVRTATR